MCDFGDKSAELYLVGAERHQLDPILDASAAGYLELPEEGDQVGCTVMQRCETTGSGTRPRVTWPELIDTLSALLEAYE